MTNHKNPPPSQLDNPAFLQLLQTLHDQSERLEEIWEAIRASAPDIAAADIRRQYTMEPDFMVAGNTRLVAGGPGFGSTTTIAAGLAGAAQLLPRNTNRLGGTIVNTGATNPVTLFLAELADVATAEPLPQIWLGPNGGSWDCRLGNVLWCGTVVGLSTAGTSVTVAEV